jgi:4-amino-4-deoxy-L-arabinose transferase-like glycosyltransferase
MAAPVVIAPGYHSCASPRKRGCVTNPILNMFGHAVQAMHGQVEPDTPQRVRIAAAADWLAHTRAGLLFVWACYIVPRAAILLIDVAPTSDGGWYFSRAEMLADGRGYLESDGLPTAFWPPGLSLVLSLVFRVFGPSLLAAGLFNLACGVLAGWLVLKLGRQLFGSEMAARSGLLLLAVYPNSIGYFPLVMTEVFYTTLLLAICWLVAARRSDWWLVAAGVLVGIATLVKAQTIVLVPLLFAIELLRETPFWRRVPAAAMRTALVLALGLLTVLPWSIRNHDQLGHWVLVSTNGGHTLLTGNNDSADGGYTPQDPVVQAVLAKGLPEIERDAVQKDLAIAWIADNPGKFLALMPSKFWQLWGPDGEAMWFFEAAAPSFERNRGLYLAVRYVNQVWYGLLLAGFIATFVAMSVRCLRSGARWTDWWLLPYGIAAYVTAIALVFSGQSRFHYPAMPFVCMACGWLVAQLWSRRSRSAGG